MNSKKKLNMSSLVFMGTMSVFSLLNIPIMAGYGLSAVVYYIVAALIFFFPCALVCAELASGWPIAGGVYIWVKEAFGIKLGRLCIWLEWINNVIVFPASLFFTISMLSHAHILSWHVNKYFILLLMLVCFWGVTFFNLKGIKYSVRLNNMCFLFGALMPCLIIVVFCALFLFTHNLLSFSSLFAHQNFFNIDVLKSSFFISVVMGYFGIQSIAFHVQDVKNPKKTYPIAILLISLVTLFLYIFTTLSIFSIIQGNHVHLIDGFFSALDIFFKEIGLFNILPFIIIMMFFGRLASLSVWVISPARGLVEAIGRSYSKKKISYINKHDMPENVLFLQAGIVTLISFFYVFVHNVEHIYWIFLTLSTVFTLIMYILVFSSCIVLRYTKTDVVRSYKIPFGMVGLWIVAGCGLLVSLFVLYFCFISPDKQKFGNDVFYFVFFAIGCIALLTLPIVFNAKKNS